MLRKNVHLRLSGQVKSIKYEGRIVRKDGTVRWIDIFGTTTIYNGTKAIIGTIIDISDRKVADHEKQNIIQDLLQKNRDLEQFAYIVSHNLRAPVANIIGITDLMKVGSFQGPEGRDIIEYLNSSAHKLDGVIRDLNLILQIKHGLDENRELLKLSDLMDDIRLNISSLNTEEEVELHTDFSAVDEIHTLKSYMYSIFYNLITNCIKFKCPESVAVIRISSRLEGNKTILSISDKGLGIDLEKNATSVFGLYKRFHLHIKGKGLGLYMVKTQVESLGGSISVTSEVNNGTTFTMEFEN
jgi:signal transduction histidine kinase